MIVILIHLIITKEKGTETYDYSDDGDDSSVRHLKQRKSSHTLPRSGENWVKQLTARAGARLGKKERGYVRKIEVCPSGPSPCNSRGKDHAKKKRKHHRKMISPLECGPAWARRGLPNCSFPRASSFIHPRGIRVSGEWRLFFLRAPHHRLGHAQKMIRVG